MALGKSKEKFENFFRPHSFYSLNKASCVDSKEAAPAQGQKPTTWTIAAKQKENFENFLRAHSIRI
jgi:hypothetical protein